MTKRKLRFRKYLPFLMQMCLGMSVFLLIGLKPAIVTSPGFAREAAKTVSMAAAPSADAAQLMQQGRSLYTAGQFSQAAMVWQQTAEMYRQAGDDRNQALALNHLALAQQQLGQLSQAEVTIAASLKLINPDKPGSKPLLAQALNAQGSVQFAAGKTEQALQTWRQATALYTELGDAIGTVGSLTNQVQAQQALGFYLQARKTLEAAQVALQQQPDLKLRAIALRSLGDVSRAVGDLERSQQVLEQSLALMQQADSSNAADVLLSLGNTARARQDFVAALSYYRAATRSPSLLTQLQAQLNQLNVYLDTGQWLEAQTLQPQIRAQIGNLPLSRTAIYAQINLVQSLAQLKQTLTIGVPDWAEIAQIAATTVQQARQLQDPQAEAYALGNLGGLYEKTGQWTAAEDLTRQALVLAQSLNAPDILYQWQWQLGRLLKAQVEREGGRPITSAAASTYVEAIASYTGAVNTLKTLRNDLVAVDSEVQFSFRERVEPVYRQFVGLLLQPGAGEPSQQNLRQAREVIESLQLAQLENFFREACLTARPAQIDRVDQSAAVVYSIILEDRVEIILSLPNQPLRHFATSIAQTETEALLDTMYRSLRRTGGLRDQLLISKQVYDLLLRPAEVALQASGVKTLVFVLDGALQNIPMASLYDGQQYLLEKYSVALAPGLQLLEPQPLTEARLKVLVGGLSEARQGFSALPGVEAEVQQVTSQLPSQTLLNQKFTSSILQEQVGATAFPIVHLATHGQFSSNAQDTFILTWDQFINVKQLDGLLQSREQGERRPIELLVLSACQTAAGDRRAVLGLAGIAVRSGARSTLATLWSVDDQSTTLLMVQFYRKLAQGTLTKAEALRQAQLELQKQPEFRHPYYWAPFVMVGNWL